MHEPSLVEAARSVKSALRALELLDLLTREGRPLSFSDCQEALSYPKASLHGLLRTMTAARWIAFDVASKRYALGVRVWEAGIAYTKMLPLAALARPTMERVRNVTSETVQLAVLDEFEALYIAKVDGNHLLRLDSSVGLRLKAHATGVGKMLLTGLPDDRLQAWANRQRFEAYTPHTITSADELLKEIGRIRKSGFATDREERTLGAACVAVGIRNHVGALVAAMSVSAPAVRFGKKEQAGALQQLKLAATELSATLGFASTGGEPVAIQHQPARRPKPGAGGDASQPRIRRNHASQSD